MTNNVLLFSFFNCMSIIDEIRCCLDTVSGALLTWIDYTKASLICNLEGNFHWVSGHIIDA